METPINYLHIMLINLTNHPSALWDKAQQQAASQYGVCMDMPFPAIDSEGDENYIDRLTDEYLQKILTLADGQKNKVAVHIMGEMTFSFALVEKLKNAGIRCVASTSVRDSIDLGNGQKEITFKFVKFRNYL